MLPTQSRSPKRRRRNQAQAGDYHVYTLSAETNTITGELADPTKVIRELAKDGTEVQQRDGRSGRVQKKWLSIRSSSKDREQASLSSHSADMERQRSDSKAGSTRPKPGRQRSRRAHPEGNVYKSKVGLQLTSAKVSRSFTCRPALVARTPSDGPRRIGELHIVSPLYVPVAFSSLYTLHRYAFAPASIVAPLGTVALIANCFIAPCLLNEKFRKKDLIGIGLSILGAIGVVLSGRSQNQSVRHRISGIMPIEADTFLYRSSRQSNSCWLSRLRLSSYTRQYHSD